MTSIVAPGPFVLIRYAETNDTEAASKDHKHEIGLGKKHQTVRHSGGRVRRPIARGSHTETELTPSPTF